MLLYVQKLCARSRYCFRSVQLAESFCIINVCPICVINHCKWCFSEEFFKFQKYCISSCKHYESCNFHSMSMPLAIPTATSLALARGDTQIRKIRQERSLRTFLLPYLTCDWLDQLSHTDYASMVSFMKCIHNLDSSHQCNEVVLFSKTGLHFWLRNVPLHTLVGDIPPLIRSDS